ncbi:MAG TPA: DUF2378 family protein [Polyangiaceae bacterium LLY-WYZ-15_(1-7)]|nr:hypothetical protein [Myxococcales bacterium]MAT25844.1 hypothetical protein [Sandaracinus sp.]HJL04152.1 DUF2378 family protein [Polyangiaceae bacterium LLY-WYZ-15_(1-7)]MBJ70551.1 hypothetical protein [Sandaracinus sp.]HJL12206.1 DUF2378 family protein [Polyangiaceae bacterium LLY-WYZ-15_(1-7)]
MEVETSPDRPLHGEIDVERLFAECPSSFLLKGMFFRRIAKLLGGRLDGLLARLEAPPGRAGWLPFRDYPQRDYTLLSVEAARLHHPRQSDREALRRLAREDVHVFAGSMLGRVMMSVVGDTKRALLELPGVYEKVASGPWGFEMASIGEREVRFAIGQHPGEWCYQIGQCEGIAAHYGDRLRTRAVPKTGGGVELFFSW